MTVCVSTGIENMDIAEGRKKMNCKSLVFTDGVLIISHGVTVVLGDKEGKGKT